MESNYEERAFRALEALERRVTDTGLFLTLFTLAFWLFLPALALIGPKSLVWIPVGLTIVSVSLALVPAIYHERRRLEAKPGPRLAFKLLQTSRGTFALIASWALFRSVVQASDGDGSWWLAGKFFLQILTG